MNDATVPGATTTPGTTMFDDCPRFSKTLPELLHTIRLAGGTLDFLENTPIAPKAVLRSALGQNLIRRHGHRDGFGVMDGYSLTAEGRRLIGMPRAATLDERLLSAFRWLFQSRKA